ncbi:MAG: hypothetical protein IKX66_00475 [Clostridia bacterium]|nr:hypothetical protein [Clostridia bacterium]
MKKTLFAALLLLLLSCLLLASCGGGSDESTEPTAATPTTEGETEASLYTVTFRIGENKYEVTAAYGSIPVCPVDPEEDYAVRFLGWDKEIAPVEKDTTYTAVCENGAVILPAKGGAKGIFTMTYDDAQLDVARWVNEENKKYGLHGSCMLIAGWTRVTSNIAAWRTVFADGTLEPESHSMNHDTLPAEGNGKYETHKIYNTQPKYKTELIDARALLREQFPGSDVLCFAPASNTLSTSSFEVGTNGEADLTRPLSDGGAEKVACETYYAIRQGARGIQSLDPTYGVEAGGWYNLKMQGLSSYEGEAKLQAAKSWIDRALSERGWLIVMCHGIEGPNAKGTSPLEITEAEADALFAYAGEYVERGELWSATFGEATKYLREKQNTTVEELYENDTVYVRMKIDRTAKDGKTLDADVFNYPLTVEVRVPADWQTVKYRVNGKNVTAPVYVKNGISCAMAEIVPGADGKTTVTAISRAN